jgi:poly-gamma-glutamate capsule biosynthesis protein CapA/YwtB (metallophosphatase superfamily)
MQPGDIAVVSVHWGSNWGYDVRGLGSQVDLAPDASLLLLR